MSNHTEDFKGRVKEAVGDVTDDQDLVAEGRLDQVKASVKDGIDKVGDKLQALVRH